MSAPVNVDHNARFKTGRLMLLVSAALMALNHIGLMFALDEPVLFTGFAAFLYALMIIAIPFRRHER